MFPLPITKPVPMGGTQMQGPQDLCYTSGFGRAPSFLLGLQASGPQLLSWATSGPDGSRKLEKQLNSKAVKEADRIVFITQHCHVTTR